MKVAMQVAREAIVRVKTMHAVSFVFELGMIGLTVCDASAPTNNRAL